MSYRGIRRYRTIVSEERVPCNPSRHSQRCSCGPNWGERGGGLSLVFGNASNAAGAPSTFPPAGWATHSLGEVIVLLVQDWREPRLRQHEEDHHDSRTPRVPDFDPAWKSAFFPPSHRARIASEKKKLSKIHSKSGSTAKRSAGRPLQGVRRRSMAAFPSAAGASRRALVIFVTLLLTGTHSPHEQQDQRVVLTTTKSAVSQNG